MESNAMTPFEEKLIKELTAINQSLRALPRLVQVLEQVITDVEEKHGYSGRSATSVYLKKKAVATKAMD